MEEKFGKRLGSGRGHKPTRKAIQKAVRLIEVEGKPATEAMKEIGYSNSTAGAKQTILTQNPIYLEEKSRLQKAILAKNPKIFERMARVVNQGLGAYDTRLATGKFGFQDERKVPDFQTRHKYVDIVAKIFGELVPEKSQGGMTVYNLTQVLTLVQQAEKERGLTE